MCADPFKFRLAHNQVFLTVLRAHKQEPARKASNNLRGYKHRAFPALQFEPTALPILHLGSGWKPTAL